MACEGNGTKLIISAKLRHATHITDDTKGISITISEKWVRK